MDKDIEKDEFHQRYREALEKKNSRSNPENTVSGDVARPMPTNVDAKKQKLFRRKSGSA